MHLDTYVPIYFATLFGAMGSFLKKRCAIKETTNCCNNYTYQLVLEAVSIKPRKKNTHQVRVEMSCIQRKGLEAGGGGREIDRKIDRPRKR